jgi:predicted anti-sigma-YlaC factor YlaD
LLSKESGNRERHDKSAPAIIIFCIGGYSPREPEFRGWKREMNCEKCQELLSDFLDDAMSDARRAELSAHLEECLECYHAHADLDAIISFCREARGQYDAPPNEQALWLRIRNTVESEATARTGAPQSTRRAQRESWFARALNRSWQLSFSQMVTAVVAIVIFASLATVVGVRSLQNSSDGSTATNLKNTGNAGNQPVALTANDGSSQVFQLKDHPWQQEEINYLTQVVEERKSHWNPQLRADFERNLELLNQTVNESLDRLSAHPHDEVTEEMLNVALNDKMQLLKEFSDF